MLTTDARTNIARDRCPSNAQLKSYTEFGQAFESEMVCRMVAILRFHIIMDGVVMALGTQIQDSVEFSCSMICYQSPVRFGSEV